MKIRTKIICTAGPSVDSDDAIRSMVKHGMSILRINCSHGDEKFRNITMERVRRIEKELQTPVGVMVDLQGPKLRVGDLPEPFLLHQSDEWTFSIKEPANLANKIIPTSFRKLPDAVEVGSRIYLNDGLIRTEVLKKSAHSVTVKILHGGFLESRKGMNIPHYRGRLSILNSKDKADLLWGLKNDVDFVAVSFIRSAEDVQVVRKFISKHAPNKHPLVIAKIEKPEAVDNMDAIIAESDGILVARGDLGIEMNLSKVPVIQKQLIEKCRFAKKPVIIATQMLDSMRTQPIPTRAEVSDVASAIYAGADVVMLTGETSAGKYPVKATEMMHHIISDVENHMVQKNFRKTPKDFDLTDYREAFLFNVMQIADDIDAKAIVMLAKRGQLTPIMSKFHPKQPVFSLASDVGAYRQLCLYWGVFPIETPMRVVERRIEHGIEVLKNSKLIKKKDRIVFVYWDYLSDNLNVKIVEA